MMNNNLIKLKVGDTINVSQITDFLYLGGIVYDWRCLKDFIQEKNIGAILSIWDDDMLQIEKLGLTRDDYLYIYIHDNTIANIMQHFDTTYNFISQKIKENKKVYVHCHAGISRSATIIIYFIMRHYNVDLTRAFIAVNNKRHVRPNSSFVRQLQMAEESLMMSQ
ncbi:ptp2 [Alphabaculovirus alterspexiguae]|uniref:Ptp2 n=1 Tax=Spodoptera exigua multiple nucleopolyhedrovirus TaxID=10454 RepID=A0A3G2JTV9_9ABAC|nr:ptp2 [Spodoptera exigua multiple nucleopolyhedrovirus]AYN44978.1 ptp2 [Spodoptera exigua multiple nucleopolyhedrovirus]